MKAMILAAGLGTRLRPLTDHRPKALVEVAGRPLLEITLSRLRAFGIRDVIINVHHFADVIVNYLQSNGNFGMNIAISREDVLLDTGGALKKAAHFLAGESDGDMPFLLHNVDVLSSIDLRRMTEFHTHNKALATLAVQNRETSRYLLFDERDRLCGRRYGSGGTTEMVRAAQQPQPLAFSGIHVIATRFLGMMTEAGAFSIITSYLRLAAQNENIIAFRADDNYWRDLGNPASVAQADEDAKFQPVL